MYELDTGEEIVLSWVVVCNDTVVCARVVLQEKLGWGVRPISQNPYPIFDQNQRFLLPNL